MSDLHKNCNQGQQKQTLRVSSPLPWLLDCPKTLACLGLKVTKTKLKKVQTTKTTQETVAAGLAIKLEHELKLKELLGLKMSLEEADLWFNAYKAFISFNKRNMARLEISVRRQLLNNCLHLKIASALKNNKDITPTTRIEAPNKCWLPSGPSFKRKTPYG